MRIGLDFHGLVVDSHGLKATLLKELYNAEVPVEACRKLVQKHCGQKAFKRYRHVQRLVYETKKYHERLEPVSGALRRIQQLVERKHELFIVSSSSPQAASLARQWLKAHEVDLPFIASGRRVSKAPVVTELRLDWFYDDDLLKLTQLMGVVPNLGLFRQPHNANIIDAGPNIVVVKSWAEVGKTPSGLTEMP
ncbi:hypothetical protein M0Q28_01155 [Patescibacteria group bacterium]|jgi:hypothetical protein|nr:hypothetical protein [Patescibacteria group bacterium]